MNGLEQLREHFQSVQTFLNPHLDALKSASDNVFGGEMFLSAEKNWNKYVFDEPYGEQIFALFAVGIAQFVRAAFTEKYKKDHGKNPNPLLTLWMTFITCFGGTLVTSLLLGKPPGFMYDDRNVIIVILAWLLVNYVPLLFSVISIYPLRFCLGCAVCVVITKAIMFGVGIAVAEFPQSIISPIVFGVLIATGGGKTMNFTRKMMDDSGAHSDLTNPSLFYKTIILWSAIYTLKVKFEEEFFVPLSAVQMGMFVSLAFVWNVVNPLQGMLAASKRKADLAQGKKSDSDIASKTTKEEVSASGFKSEGGAKSRKNKKAE